MSGTTKGVDAEKARRFKSLFVASMAHPIRVKCLARMAEAPTSSSAIARELRLDAPTVNYHVQALLDHHLIERVERRPVRGAMENIYRTRVLPVITDEELDGLTKEERIGYVETLLSLYASDATFALEKGTLLGNDWHIARTAMQVDQQGWDDIRATFTGVYGRIAEIKAESEERIKGNGKPSIRIMSFQSLFELPHGKERTSAGSG
jgi:DNA-binding transcriptional ArsR family regulator